MSFPQPIGRQIEVLYLPSSGHTAVLGTAGSGKTTLAILRAAYLADPETDNNGTTLLLTFNRALVTYLKHLRQTIPNVVVENYHLFARGYLKSRKRMRWNGIINPQPRRNLIVKAVLEVMDTDPLHPILQRPIEFFEEEFSWIARHGILSKEDYREAERIGRSTRAPRKDRDVVFTVYEEYKKLRTAGGQDYDWDDIATAVYEELETDSSERRYKHIVVDEGQDFSPMMIKSLVSAIPSNGSLTFFGDVAQQIYGQRMSWRSAGMEVDKVWRFRENYRNSRQIARLGLEISKMPYFQGTADLVQPTTATADGPLPTIVQCSSLEEEIKLVAKQATLSAKTLTVAVLFRSRHDEAKIRQHLPRDSTRLHRDLKHWPTGPGVYFGTYHAAKGLEFDAVILPFCTDKKLPSLELVEAFGEHDASVADGRLLYVGVTRAKTRLIITHTDTISRMLPTQSDLYTRVPR